jgi:membrane-bound lytic murein transglycosylase A
MWFVLFAVPVMLRVVGPMEYGSELVMTLFRRPLWILLAMALVVPALPGCRKKPPAKVSFAHELPSGELALRKISPAEYPDFTPMGQENPQQVLLAIDQSLTYLKAPSSQRYFPYLDITHDRAVATLTTLREIFQREMVERNNGAALNVAIRERFDVYKSVGGWDPETGQYIGRVLFTGYFTPIYPASLTRGGAFQWPLYKRPADLVSDEVTEISGRRTADGRLVPHLSRTEIERDGQLAGQEYVWLANRFDAYIITIQGSAMLRLPDGRTLEVGYAGNNGHPYVSPGMAMVADGVIRKEDLSLKTMRAYFDANPGAMDRYLLMNPRTVFFTERPGGPFGSLNAKVTPFATIATDKTVYPRALPAFLNVPISRGSSGTPAPFRGFMLDQDTGGAIRAAGRADIYMGVGPVAENLAGRQLNEGELYYLAVK